VKVRTGRLEGLAPRLQEIAPRVELATLPTPVLSYPHLAARLGLAELLVKRDDATSPLYGGTKVRGLEFFFGRALAEGRGEVLTVGSVGSHHALATAIFAREVGLGSRAVLFPHPEATDATRNLHQLTAAGMIPRTTGFLGFVPAIVRGRWSRAGGKRPLWIPPGGSTGLGALGAAEGALEVVEAARSGAFALPEDVVVAAGSCGTAAGLALGFGLAGARVRIVAVRVVPRIVASRAKILRFAKGGLRWLQRGGFTGEALFGEVALVQDEAGPGYAQPTSGGRDALALLTPEGVPVDLTYTGKAWAHVLSGALRGRRVLVWNTYGGP
jgi:D-cysteine desulfhydrase